MIRTPPKSTSPDTLFPHTTRFRSQRNYRAARDQRADRSDKARSVHQRARGKRSPARAFAGDQRDIFFECLWNGAEQLLCVELGLAHVIMTPHHALGHSGRTTSIDEKQIGGRAWDAERRTCTLLRASLIMDRKGRDRSQPHKSD